MILAVTAQQAEVIRYVQEVADPLVTVALILRSPDDFIDPVTHQPLTPVLDETTGIVLRTLIDTVRRPAADHRPAGHSAARCDLRSYTAGLRLSPVPSPS